MTCRRRHSLVAAWLLVSCENEADRTTGSTASQPNLREVQPTGAKAKRIAVVPKGTTHEFWKSVHAGAINRCVVLGWPNWVQEMIVGHIIILAAAIDQIRARRTQ